MSKLSKKKMKKLLKKGRKQLKAVLDLASAALDEKKPEEKTYAFVLPASLTPNERCFVETCHALLNRMDDDEYTLEEVYNYLTMPMKDGETLLSGVSIHFAQGLPMTDEHIIDVVFNYVLAQMSPKYKLEIIMDAIYEMETDKASCSGNCNGTCNGNCCNDDEDDEDEDDGDWY